MGCRAIDITGKRFGQLTVLSRKGSLKLGIGVRALWLCECDCGGTKVAVGSYLRRNRTKNCGGHKHVRTHPNRKSAKVSARNRILARYKLNATTFNRTFTLSDDEFFSIATKACVYCGQVASSCKKSAHETFFYNGIDRVDSSVGYEPGNVVSCCIMCNRAKRDYSYEDFKAWIARLIKHNTPLPKAVRVDASYSRSSPPVLQRDSPVRPFSE